jgi:hypothetical protein
MKKIIYLTLITASSSFFACNNAAPAAQNAPVNLATIALTVHQFYQWYNAEQGNLQKFALSKAEKGLQVLDTAQLTAYLGAWQKCPAVSSRLDGLRQAMASRKSANGRFGGLHRI